MPGKYNKPCRTRTSTHPSKRRLEKLAPYHIQAILLYLDGAHLDEIAERVNRSRYTVYDWLKDEVFCAELERYRQELHDLTWRKIKSKATKAAEKIAEKLDSETPFEALAAAKEILDRAGYKPADKHEISGADGGPIRIIDDVPKSE